MFSISNLSELYRRSFFFFLTSTMKLSYEYISYLSLLLLLRNIQWRRTYRTIFLEFFRHNSFAFNTTKKILSLLKRLFPVLSLRGRIFIRILSTNLCRLQDVAYTNEYRFSKDSFYFNRLIIIIRIKKKQNLFTFPEAFHRNNNSNNNSNKEKERND